MEKFLHWREMMDLKYLRAECLEDNEELVATIKDVKSEEIVSAQGKDTKPVLYFQEENILPMVVNVHNAQTIENLYGDRPLRDWVGKKIQIFACTTRVGKESVPCLRIRPSVPKSSEPEYKCSFCGKPISKDLYLKSMNKYGKAYCSKECYEGDNPTI